MAKSKKSKRSPTQEKVMGNVAESKIRCSQAQLTCEPSVVYRSDRKTVTISAEPLGTALFPAQSIYSVKIKDMTQLGFGLQECMTATWLNTSQLQVDLEVKSTAPSGGRSVEVYCCALGHASCSCDEGNKYLVSAGNPISVG